MKQSRSRQPAKADLSAEALEKLASSGLDAADAEQLGILYVNAFRTKALYEHFDARDALHFTYINPFTGDGYHDLPGRPPFYRIRYLGPDAKTTFGEKKKPSRYRNERGCSAHAYFPSINSIDWPAVAADVNISLVITEGELKAACACKHGINTIGLGGVQNFGSMQRGIEFLPELESIVWAKRNVYIIFDSDAETNKDIQRAIARLGAQLGRRGANTFEVRLPNVYEDPEKKTGIDDFIVARGPEAFEALLVKNNEDGISPVARQESLWYLNGEVVYVMDPGFFAHQRTPAVWKKDGFLTTYATLPKITRKTLRTNNGQEEIDAAKAWIEWPLRKQVGSLVYEPQAVGKSYERFTDGPEGDAMRSTFNVWPGWGREPAEGDIGPFLTLIDHIFKENPPEHRRWFLQWLAYPLQYPGVKLNTAVLIHGKGQGTGKTVIGETMGKIYGDNFELIRNAQLSSSFNRWAARKQFILGDEISGGDSHDKKLMEAIKSMITQRRVMINSKNKDEYNLRDCINYFFTSNYDDPFKLDDDDRRIFVLRMPDDRLDSIEFFKNEYGLWLDSNAPGHGTSALFWYLLNKVDTSDFDWDGRAPMTDAKRAMIAAGKSDLDDWCSTLVDSFDIQLKDSSGPYKFDIITASIALQYYRAADADGARNRVSANGLARALGRAGFRKVNQGNNVLGEKYYAIRNADHWLRASHDELAAHLKGENLKRRK